MARPRQILPGTTYLITRRCAQRAYRLRPDETSSQIFRYALALAAEKTGVSLHAVCVMSNHHHAVLTDAAGRLPEFLAELHRTTAKALNAAQGRWENLWSSERTHVVVIADAASLLDRIAYTVVNPVAAGLVEQPHEWPGVAHSHPTKQLIERPLVFFDAHGKCPPTVNFRIVHPELAAMPQADWNVLLAERVRQRVLRAQAKIREAGRSFLGRAAVLAQSTRKRAASFEPKRRPTAVVAAKDTTTLERFVGLLKAFQVAYRDAREQWLDKVRSVAFPPGTWGMRRDPRVVIAVHAGERGGGGGGSTAAVAA